MRVALLNTKSTPRADYLLEAFAAGLRVHGDDAFWVRRREDLDLLDQADCGAQVCFPNRHHDGNDLAVFRLEAFDRLAKAGKRVVTIDTGFVRSQPEIELARMAGVPNTFHVEQRATWAAYDHTMYYAVGFDGIKRNANYGPADVPADRWARLGMKLHPWRKDGQHVLLIGQPLHGQSSQHIDIRAWYADVAAAVRATGRRVILYRPHPRIFSLRTNAGRRKRDELGVRKYMGSKIDLRYSKNRLLKDDLKGAWATVVFTSNAAVESVLKGVPVFACDPACIAWDVAGHKLSRLEAPALPDRTAWAHRLAYSQWTVAEMRDGQCWRHLRGSATK